MAELTIHGLHKRFGPVEVLRGIDLKVSSGEFAVLVGPSGCGKSTLLRTIAGLEDIDKGTIEIDGREVNDVRPRDRDIAMVFQNYALYPYMNVSDNIAFGLRARRTPEAETQRRVKGAAELLGIGGLLDRHPRHLSGGQRQRVAIGRAIVRNPKLFLFDEPLSNLDAQLRDEMRSEIKRLHQDLAATMIYVTHDQIEAMTLADRIVLMNSGQIEQVGAPLDLYDRPATRFVAGFLGSPKINLLPGRLIANGRGLSFEASDGTNLALPMALAAAAHAHADRPVTLGVRPQHIGEASGIAGPNEVTLRTSIELVQPTGSRTYVTARLANATVVAEADAHAALKPGAAIELAFDMGHAILIDPESGKVFAHGLAE
jgi:multiple sugar transport system ATP-binding protein